MKKIIIAVVVFACGSLFAQPMPPQPRRPAQDDPIARQLFAPDLLMQHQSELKLQDSQRAAIRSEIVKLQTKVIELQFQLSDESERLAGLLKATPADEAKILEQADKVMSLEREIKRAHLAALVRIKNVLTPDQIAKVQEIKRRMAED